MLWVTAMITKPEERATEIGITALTKKTELSQVTGRAGLLSFLVEIFQDGGDETLYRKAFIRE